MRTRHTFRLPPNLAGKLADYAGRKHVPQALIVETALASHLSPDGADPLEAVLARRLDRMSRQIERLERHVTISNEALAVFVRFWLTSTRQTLRWPLRRPRAGSAMRALSKLWGAGSHKDASLQTNSSAMSTRPAGKQ